MNSKNINVFLIKNSVALIVVSVFLISCGSKNPATDQNVTDSIPTEGSATLNKTQNIFYSIPSPVQLGKLLKRAGATYDKKTLNSIDNASKYVTINSKALNLGVYGADLSYSVIYNQAQQTMLYMKSAKKMSEELGITGSFSAEIVKRMEANISNKDSLLPLISEIFLNSNQALKENEQSNISVLVLAGGFIEGLYVGTQVAKTVKSNNDIVTRIAELKGALNNLIIMLSTETNDKEVMALTDELKTIKEIYNEMPTNESSPTVIADTVKNTMTIGGKSNYSLTKEQLEKITAKAEVIRAKIIKP